MQIKYSPDADALIIRLREGTPVDSVDYILTPAIACALMDIEPEELRRLDIGSGRL